MTLLNALGIAVDGVEQLVLERLAADGRGDHVVVDGFVALLPTVRLATMAARAADRAPHRAATLRRRAARGVHGQLVGEAAQGHVHERRPGWPDLIFDDLLFRVEGRDVGEPSERTAIRMSSSSGTRGSCLLLG